MQLNESSAFNLNANNDTLLDYDLYEIEAATLSPTIENVDHFIITTTAATLLPIASSLAPPTVTLNRTRNATRTSIEIPIWVIPCYSIILLFAVIGNLLVVLTLVQNRRMRTITNVFLLNLAISDILLGVLCMPVTLVGTILRHFIFGEVLCKLLQFSQAASVAVSSWTLVAISCERYYAICHPLRSRTWQTINHANKIIALIWIGSIVCMTPIAVFSQLMPTSRQGLRKCREHWPPGSLAYERAYNIFLDFALLVFPLLVLSFTYILITRTLYISMRNERAMIFGGSSINTGSSASRASLRVGSDSGRIVVDLAAGNTTADNGNGNGSYRSLNSSHSFRYATRSGATSGMSLGGGQYQEVLLIDNGNQRDLLYEEQQQHQQQTHNNQQYYYVDSYSHGGSSRRLLSSYDGRRHLYCMRSASVRQLRRSNNDMRRSCYNSGTSPSPSLTLGALPQQQRFLLQRQQHQQQYAQHTVDRRKSLSTPSLRLNAETALRRSNETKSLESKKRVVKMLFVLVLEFFICWTPLYVINTATMFIGPAIYEYVGYTSISFLQLLAYSSSCCNPITYCFMNANFRRAFVDTFKGMRFTQVVRFFRKRSKNEQNLSVAGNSIALANSGISGHTMLESPRL